MPDLFEWHSTFGASVRQADAPNLWSGSKACYDPWQLKPQGDAGETAQAAMAMGSG